MTCKSVSFVVLMFTGWHPETFSRQPG